MRTLSIFALFVVLALFLAAPMPAQEEGLHWFTDYGEAIREAKKTGKAIFLEFRCEP